MAVICIPDLKFCKKYFQDRQLVAYILLEVTADKAKTPSKHSFLTDIDAFLDKEETHMTNKAKVRVIKKSDVVVAKQPEKAEAKTKRAAAREMVSNVSNWVSDFQTRKRDETMLAFEQLFVKQPQPTES